MTLGFGARAKASCRGWGLVLKASSHARIDQVFRACRSGGQLKLHAGGLRCLGMVVYPFSTRDVCGLVC